MDSERVPRWSQDRQQNPRKKEKGIGLWVYPLFVWGGLAAILLSTQLGSLALGARTEIALATPVSVELGSEPRVSPQVLQ